MATVVQVPQDTRFAEIGAAINQGLEEFLARRRELRDKEQRDDMLATLLADAESGDISDEELAQGVLQSFQPGQDAQAAAFLSALLNVRSNRARVDVTARGQDLGLLGQREGIQAQRDIATERTGFGFAIEKMRGDLAKLLEGSRRAGAVEVAEINVEGRIEAARQSILTKNIPVNFFDKSGAKKTFTIPEVVAAQGEPAIKQFILKRDKEALPEGFSITEPGTIGIPALKLKLFELWIKNVDFKDLTPEAEAQVIGSFNVFIRDLFNDPTMQTLFGEGLEKAGVVTPGAEKVAGRLAESRLKAKLTSGDTVPEAELAAGIKNLSIEELGELLKNEKVLIGPHFDALNERLNALLRETVPQPRK